ncbi:serine/threonine-protein kinase [Streptomyces griseorubiginosus]|uniref:serine/threonine-protein kinase n=1 Tax=Streptomyces griseorubiginosus TaxID=67304 RepID=UPI00076C9370|nr:serine/threonine-protein kinase [Streptomyces griseorubiginosus]KUM74366.1 kinase [Streptomyces griseorubiginosus]
MSSGETNGKGQDDAGRLLAGRYRVVGQLGRGGMGVVWRAVDEVLGREVAVKELRTYHDADGPELADLRLRMQREARAAARVRHPGVVAVHDIGEVEGRPLIVMELVEGPSLDQVLRKSGPLDPREAAGIGAKVMDALAAAHRAGVLHRDVKPGNILLDHSGRVLLTDFGIATMEDPGDGAATSLTRTGHLVGSLDYMAPERAQGADPGPASDVWALGATLYAAVEGAAPFRRTSTFSTLTAIVGEPLPEPQRAGPLAPVLRRLLDKRPEARPGAEEARDLLQAVADTPATDSATTTLRGTEAQETRVRTEPDGGPVLPAAFRMPGPVGAAGAAGAAHGAGPQPSEGPGAGGPSTDPTVVTGAGGPSADPTVVPGQGTVTPAVAGFGDAEQGHAAQVHAPGAGLPGAQGGAPGGGFPGAHGGAPGEVGPLVHGQGSQVSQEQPPTAAIAASGSPRRRGRALLAAVAVAVVLAAAGTTAALLNGSGEADADARPIGSGTSPSASSTPSGRTDTDRSAGAKPTSGDEKKSPSAKATSGGKGGSDPTSGASPSAKATSGGGTSGKGDGHGGGSGESGGGGPTDEPSTPAPACTAIGGGKYNCTVWKTAKSYTASGAEAGILYAGTNYFFCQSNLGRRETSGEWTNVWWARTDDDSGNTGVYVSVVYVKGGGNDEPVPGLPVC